MPLPILVGIVARVAIGAAAKVIAKRAATAAAKKAAQKAVPKALPKAAPKPAVPKPAPKGGGKGPGNTVGKHKAKKGRKQKPHKDCGKVSKYNKAPKKLGERNADHVPSGGAMKAAAMAQLKRMNVLNKLSPKELQSVLNSVYNNAQTITIPEDVHKAGRTYGNKNKPLIKGDSRDLNGAFKKDTAAIQKEMDKVDHGCSDAYKAAVKQLSKVDFDKYVNDAVKSHKLVRSALGAP